MPKTPRQDMQTENTPTTASIAALMRPLTEPGTEEESGTAVPVHQGTPSLSPQHCPESNGRPAALLEPPSSEKDVSRTGSGTEPPSATLPDEPDDETPCPTSSSGEGKVRSQQPYIHSAENTPEVEVPLVGIACRDLPPDRCLEPQPKRVKTLTSPEHADELKSDPIQQFEYIQMEIVCQGRPQSVKVQCPVSAKNLLAAEQKCQGTQEVHIANAMGELLDPNTQAAQGSRWYIYGPEGVNICTAQNHPANATNVEDRLSRLHLQQAWVAKDEIHYYMDQITAKGQAHVAPPIVSCALQAATQVLSLWPAAGQAHHQCSSHQ